MPTTFFDLRVVEGPDRGMVYPVQEGTYRVIGRAPEEHAPTDQMTFEGDRQLDGEQRRVVEGVLARHGGLRSARLHRGPDIPLQDGSVSRSHALVWVVGGVVRLADLMSTNGTRIDAKPVDEAPLSPGARFQIGKTTFTVEVG